MPPADCTWAEHCRLGGMPHPCFFLLGVSLSTGTVSPGERPAGCTDLGLNLSLLLTGDMTLGKSLSLSVIHFPHQFNQGLGLGHQFLG